MNKCYNNWVSLAAHLCWCLSFMNWLVVWFHEVMGFMKMGSLVMGYQMVKQAAQVVWCGHGVFEIAK